MFWLTICCATLLSARCNGIMEATMLDTFEKQFRAPQPLPLFLDAPKETRIKFVKSTSMRGLTLDLINEPNFTEKFLLIIIGNNEFLG